MLSPCPLSFGSSDPTDCDALCSPILNLFFNVHEDQVLDGVGFEQPTHNIIFDEYVWESEQESVVEDDLLLIHRSLIIHLMINWNFPKLSRLFILR